jgi:hypothetical protein
MPAYAVRLLRLRRIEFSVHTAVWFPNYAIQPNLLDVSERSEMENV